MQIVKKRTETNKAFTSGPLIVNDEVVADYTLEHTPSMIPTGIYQVTLVNDPAKRRRQLAIVAEDYQPTETAPYVIATFVSGNSYHDVSGRPDIIIGQKIIPGAVTLSSEVFDRLFDRIEKCIARRERITLYITDHMIKQIPVPRYWLELSNHGCGPTTIHCETNEHGDILIYDNDELIRTHTIEDQKCRYQESALQNRNKKL